jgi:hypothetical protein
MSAKKVVGFLLCRSAFTQRNATSILLVVLFFAVYVMAGGKVTTELPRMQSGGVFGGLDGSNDVGEPQNVATSMPELTKDESKNVLGIEESEQRQERVEAINKRGRLFTPEEVEKAEEEKIDPDGLIQGADFTNRREQWRLERSEKKPSDTLQAIEERLQIRRRQ